MKHRSTTSRCNQLRRRLIIGSVLFPFLVLVAVACGSGSIDVSSATGGIRVVAAENFWGNIAAQLGGDRVSVRAIISSPDTDPHDYEATPGDGRAVATAHYVIFNGVSYDPWVDKVLDANPSSGRITLKVQSLLHLKDDDNPHRWYSPGDVWKVIDQITADYKRIDPAEAIYFDTRNASLKATGFQEYNDLIKQIKQNYAGTPVGATESIVLPLSDALGLKMMTPPAFLRAISEGTDPSAQDKATFDSQIEHRQIEVLLFNSQNATPDVQQLVDAAKAKGIEVVDVTETLDPPNARFQDWQSRQLRELAAALAKATGR